MKNVDDEITCPDYVIIAISRLLLPEIIRFYNNNQNNDVRKEI